MNKDSNLVRFSVVAFMVALAGLYRILPHPFNFSPVGAMALFGGAYFANRINSFIIPLLTLWISDLVLNNVIYAGFYPTFTWFYEGFYWVYGSFILIACIGWLLKGNIKIWSVPLAAISGSIMFFVVSNFGVWISGTMYPLNWQGLILCFTAGLPFFSTTLVGDLVFSALMFGAFDLLQRRFGVLQIVKI